MSYEQEYLANLSDMAEAYEPEKAWDAFEPNPVGLFPGGIEQRLAKRKADGEEFHAALKAEGWGP